jgi:adenylate cyclase
MEESKEKKFIKNMFQYYLTPNVVEDLIKSPEKLVLGGQKKEMVVFFSDIRDFTSISEKLKPEDLTELLNKYLTSMTDIIMENKGVVDKYIGDAIMAFWGAPVENEDKVSCACLSVISMSLKLKELNRELVGLNFPEIKIGMGLNLGEMVVGNMGSKNRFNYTVMGDEVNFASRLEGLNKIYGTECLVSLSIYEKLENDVRFIFRFIDNVIVKGKKEPKKIYELVTCRDENTLNMIEGFNKAMDFYISGDFSKAGDLFNENYLKYEDLASKVFYERCLVLKENPLTSWNGVYEFKSK